MNKQAACDSMHSVIGCHELLWPLSFELFFNLTRTWKKINGNSDVAYKQDIFCISFLKFRCSLFVYVAFIVEISLFIYLFIYFVTKVRVTIRYCF
jgi:hypothetical protein